MIIIINKCFAYFNNYMIINGNICSKIKTLMHYNDT